MASTGAAAVLVGGRTFHSFFGLGIMEGGVAITVKRALDERRVVKRLGRIDGFVLDEVSMIPGPALRAAEMICRAARRKNLPWGGARVIAVGDFAQLPPVNRFGGEKEWAFLDEVWERSQFVAILLKTMMRCQDQDYMEVLNDIREGVVGERAQTYLNDRILPEEEIHKQRDTPRLFPKRDMAEAYNGKRLEEVKKNLMEFPTVYTGDPRSIEVMKRNANRHRHQLPRDARLCDHDPQGTGGHVGRNGLRSQASLGAWPGVCGLEPFAEGTGIIVGWLGGILDPCGSTGGGVS